MNTPPFDCAEIVLPAGKFIRIYVAGASNGLKYINGLSIDGQPTDQTSLPESIIHTRGDLTFSLSAVPNILWGSAEPSAPPSFAADSSA